LIKKTFAVDIDGTITENGFGMINLEALGVLRHLKRLGHNVVFVSGRSSVESYLLAVFAGTTLLGVGENGGCITKSPNSHLILGDQVICNRAFSLLKENLTNVNQKPVFPRMSEVVLERTFDIEEGRQIFKKNNLKVSLSDSTFAYHINSQGIDKAKGLTEALKILEADKEDLISIGDSETDVSMFQISHFSIALGNSSDQVKKSATLNVEGRSGDGLIEAINKILPDLA